VSNAGPGIAKSVKLGDNLPGGVAGSWAVSGPDSDDCVSPIVGNALDCDFGDLATGASRTVTLTAATSEQECTTYDNTATATSGNHPNAQGSDEVNCLKPGLGVIKTAVAATISAGDTASFTIEVKNTGEGVAKDVTLTDTLPGGVSGPWTMNPDDSDCSIVAGVLSCEFGDLDPGGSRTVTVEAQTDFENCTVLDNTAIGDASNAPEDSDSASIDCQKPDLSVTKTGNGTINAGEEVTFSVEVANAGPGTARSVNLTDSLPMGTAGPWAITTQPGGNPCSISNGTLSCEFGDLLAQESRTVTVAAATDYENCVTYDNSATAGSENAPDAEDSASVECLKPAVSIKKTGNGTVDAGEDVVFTIEVSNAGPGVAKSESLQDSLPAGAAGPWAITTQPGGAPCTISNGKLSCQFGDLGPGQKVTVKVKAPTSQNRCRRYDNTATAFAENAPEVTDDASVRCVKPPIEPRLLLNKKADKRRARPGDLVRYTITVRNVRKGSIAKNLKVCDRLPRLMSVVAKGRSAFFQNGRLCWRISKLPYSTRGKSFSYLARIARNARPGTRLRNVVLMGRLRDTQTVVVRPQQVGSVGRRPTPVTG
jgi:uncharacterized repeat protein (TIGR01451 family)